MQLYYLWLYDICSYDHESNGGCLPAQNCDLISTSCPVFTRSIPTPSERVPPPCISPLLLIHPFPLLLRPQRHRRILKHHILPKRLAIKPHRFPTCLNRYLSYTSLPTALASRYAGMPSFCACAMPQSISSPAAPLRLCEGRVTIDMRTVSLSMCGGWDGEKEWEWGWD